MLKTFLVILVAVSCGTIGDIILAKGMKEMGDISAMSFRGGLDTVYRVITSPKIILGTALVSVFFFLWLIVLSWEDLTVALPMTALNFIVVAFVSQYFLGEVVSPLRWAGTAVICIGVFIISISST